MKDLLPTTGDKASQSEIAEKFREDAYQAFNHPRKSLMEAHLLGAGLVGGIVNHVKENPQRAAQAVGESLIGGAVIGAGLGILAAEAPVLGIACAGGATALGAKWVWDKIDPSAPQNQLRNSNIKRAMDAVWSDNGNNFYKKHLPLVEQNLGKDGFDVCSGLLGGTVAGGAFRFGPKALASLQQSEFVAGIKFATLDKAVWKPRADGSKVQAGHCGEVAKFPDGRTVSKFGIATETKFRNGDVLSEYPNGAKELRTKNGTEVQLPNGEKRSQRFSSEVRIEKADGTIIERDLTRETVTKPDGTRLHRDDLYGYENYRKSDGFEAHTNYDGSTTFHHKDGTISTQYPDGRRHTLTDTGRIYEDAQGNRFFLDYSEKSPTWNVWVKK